MARSAPHLASLRHSTAGPRVVLVHGFTQTGASWEPVIERLAARWAVETVDLPGHGGSADVDADLAGAARGVAAHVDGALCVGYSLGARVVLRAAIDGHLDAGAVLVGATAGIDDASARSARRTDDEALARRIEAEGVDAFLESWVTQPLFGPRRPDAGDLRARRTNASEGLARSLRRCGTGTMDPPWWDELDRVEVPSLVVWGGRDAKFAALGRRLADGIGPRARTAEIAGAHHACHLDDPAAFVAALEDFATALPRPGG